MRGRSESVSALRSVQSKGGLCEASADRSLRAVERCRHRLDGAAAAGDQTPQHFLWGCVESASMAPSAFEFFSVPRIVFGRGTLARLRQLAAGFGNRALIVVNGGESNAGPAGKGLSDTSVPFSKLRLKVEPTGVA